MTPECSTLYTRAARQNPLYIIRASAAIERARSAAEARIPLEAFENKQELYLIMHVVVGVAMYTARIINKILCIQSRKSDSSSVRAEVESS